MGLFAKPGELTFVIVDFVIRAFLHVFTVELFVGSLVNCKKSAVFIQHILNTGIRDYKGSVPALASFLLLELLPCCQGP